jgi:hypothetical protein
MGILAGEAKIIVRVGLVFGFVIANLFITVAMVIAPPGSQAEQFSDAYRLANLAVAVVALGLAVWRKWYASLFLFGLVQLVGFIFVAGTIINNLGS